MGPSAWLLMSGGISLCSHSSSLAVADFSGREHGCQNTKLFLAYGLHHNLQTIDR